MSESWRLIIDGPVDGAVNMALDRAVLRAHEAGESPATLRLYLWTRPTATLGRFQRLDGVDVEFCVDHGVDVVRRPTGGRGVLHDDELTYGVIAGIRDGIPRGTSASYRFLCSALVEAYRLLGVPADLTSRSRGVSGSAACYLHTTPADLSLGAAKLSGSAQVWGHESVLQHGSFVISRDLAREAAVFRLDDASAAKLAAETATLEDSLGVGPSVETIADAVARGFERALGVTLVTGAYSDAELADADSMIADAFIAGVTPSR